MKHFNLVDTAFLLKRTSLFHHLDLDLLLTIADKMEPLSYKEGDTLFVEGQEAQRLYLIVEGRVDISEEGMHLATLASGEFLGDEALFQGRPRAYRATCQSRVILFALSRSHLFGILEECPSVAKALIEAYASKIHFRQR